MGHRGHGTEEIGSRASRCTCQRIHRSFLRPRQPCCYASLRRQLTYMLAAGIALC
jgi:hypothetical protein